MGAEGGTVGWKLSGITGEEYVRLLKAYDTELQRDDFVLGATVFTAGPTPDWANFDTDEISHLLIGEVPHVPEFVLGFLDLANAMRARGLDPGVPLENEHPEIWSDGTSIQRQRTATGEMYWFPLANQCLFAGQGRAILYNGGNLLVTVTGL